MTVAICVIVFLLVIAILVSVIRAARRRGKRKFADAPYDRAGKLKQHEPRNDLDDLY